MKKNVGIWIDRQKTFIVSILKDQECETFDCIESKMAERLNLSGRARTRKTSYGPQSIDAEGKLGERRKHQLRQYYQEVIRSVRDARRILIFGPGSAKNELEKEMRKHKDLLAKQIHIETTDKMTETQIKTKVRDFFRPRI